MSAASTFVTLEHMRFDNRNLEALPVDKSLNPNSRQVPGAVFSLCTPQPVVRPRIVAASPDALSLLGLDPAMDWTSPEFAAYFSGSNPIPGSMPAAHCYCGHQFGSFAGQLGDGAAMYLGEVINPATSERWELQLKGSGPTPFSRSSDGRKVLRSSIREFLASEALHNLGIPTTRSATIVTSDSTVARDIFYSGNVIQERCTVISRIAQNFFRFGSFEIFKAGNPALGVRQGPSAGREDLKKILMEHVITYYPDIAGESDDRTRYRLFFEEVLKRTVDLVVMWQTLGFVHGVLNTDNMSIMGLTIDYGPFAFMEGFDEDFTPNGSDGSARYSYKRQVAICKWNLERLSEALSPLLDSGDATRALTCYDDMFREQYAVRMRRKLGLLCVEEGDTTLIEDYFKAMGECWTDFTDSFQCLNILVRELCVEDNGTEAKIERAVQRMVSRSLSPEAIASAQTRKLKIVGGSRVPEGQLRMIMALIEADPQQASSHFGGIPVEDLRAEIQGELSKFDMASAIRKQTEEVTAMSEERKKERDGRVWREWLSRYVVRIQREMSPGSADERVETMRMSNPSFVIRNWICQKAIEAAEEGDYSKVRKVLELAQQPFNPDLSTFINEQSRGEDGYNEFLGTAPEWAPSLTCTCSS
mmetsp:Transcript_16831/g.25307  ORF Transcript_16831/g.25307 Transcript_16831/m.25307 type:complete len:644 (-) Transcript_16831:250-2181(-)